MQIILAACQNQIPFKYHVVFNSVVLAQLKYTNMNILLEILLILLHSHVGLRPSFFVGSKCFCLMMYSFCMRSDDQMSCFLFIISNQLLMGKEVKHWVCKRFRLCFLWSPAWPVDLRLNSAVVLFLKTKWKKKIIWPQNQILHLTFFAFLS